MKKIICLMLCIVMICFTFVGCKETIIGEDLQNRNDNSDNNAKIEILNMYVVVGAGTSDQAKETVPSQINAYLKETYQVHLNINYCTAEEYATKVLDSLADGVEEDNRADIVLINDISLFNTLYNSNKLAVLTEFYNDKNYQKLNAIVEDKLLAASLIKEEIPGQENVAPESIKYVYNYYTVPNNHVIGEYQYIVIDKAQARDELHYSSEKISAMNYKGALDEYKAAIGDQYVSLHNGNYELKLLLEYGCTTDAELKAKVAEYCDANPDVLESLGMTKDAYVDEYYKTVENNGEVSIKAPIKKVNFVNIASYPNATSAEAFSSAYAVIKSLKDVGTLSEEDATIIGKHYSKCMDIILALNTDAQLRNMLQYGYVGTNYTFIKDEKNQNTNAITFKAFGDSTNPVSYDMNLFYTGNPYIAYYCDEIGWNSVKHTNILKQNAASYTLQEKTENEAELIDLESLDIAFNSDVKLPSNGINHGDVVITWSTETEGVEISGNTLTIPEASSEQILTIVLDATFVCVDEASGESSQTVATFTVEVGPLA